MKKTFIFFAVIFANFCLFADEGALIDKNKFILNDGITFYCNDISFEILGIYVENENYFIKQNKVGVGSKFSEIKKEYKNIQGKKANGKILRPAKQELFLPKQQMKLI